MENLDVGKFNPKKEELIKIVSKSNKIIVSDFRDLKQIEAIKESRLSLRKVEIQIEKDGKKYREKARGIINYVLEKEKELKKITSPEIERLKEIEEKSEVILLKDKRLKELPDRKKRLEDIGDNIEIGDDYLLELDDLEFVTYFNQRVADKNEADRIAEENRAEMARAKAQSEQEAKEKKLEEEKEALKIKEQEAQDKIDKANEAIDKKNKEAQDKIDEANRKIEADKLDLQHKKELQEADERAKKELEEKQEAEEKAKAEKKVEEERKLKKRKAYIEFLKENGCTDIKDENYHIRQLDTKIVLYKKVGEFEL